MTEHQRICVGIFVCISSYILIHCRFFERCLSLGLSERLCEVFCFSLFHFFERCVNSFLSYYLVMLTNALLLAHVGQFVEN